MAVTTTQIRDLLNRPRGLNEGTITEYITIRTALVEKNVRKALFVGVTVTNAPTDALKEAAVKFLVCVDCLKVLIDTIPAIVPEKDKGTSDIRFSSQLKSFERAATEAMKTIEEKGGTAFDIKSTASRVGGVPKGSALAGSLTQD